MAAQAIFEFVTTPVGFVAFVATMTTTAISSMYAVAHWFEVK